MSGEPQRRVQFRKRRRQVGLTQEALAHAMGVTVSAVTQWERGITSPTPRHRRHLADLLEVSLGELDVLLDPDAEPADLESVAVPGWLNTFTTLEQGAGELMVVEFVAVSGLLQTRAYADAVVRNNHDPLTEQAIDSRVSLRMARQQALLRPDEPLRLSLLLDESVLLRPVGGRRVMVEQIDHLLKVVERPNVRLRILPFDGPVYTGAANSFSLIVRRGERTPFMLCIENAEGVSYIETVTVIGSHVRVFRYLEAAAFDHQQTVARLERAKDTYR
jgi:transcriptional regulator with XRE-family HTH domain